MLPPLHGRIQRGGGGAGGPGGGQGVQGGGGAGGPDPLKNKNNNKGFHSNTGPYPLKNLKATISQHSMLGHHQPASEMPFQWCVAGEPMIASL